MIENLTLSSFSECLGTRFRLHDGATAPVEMELVEAAGSSTNSSPGGQSSKRVPFTVVFRGPLKPLLPQRIYTLEHDMLGSLEIFIVPIGPDGERGMRYEAVFA